MSGAGTEVYDETSLKASVKGGFNNIMLANDVTLSHGPVRWPHIA